MSILDALKIVYGSRAATSSDDDSELADSYGDVPYIDDEDFLPALEDEFKILSIPQHLHSDDDI